MLDTDELLARLEERKVRNVDIAKALGLPDSRIPEIRRKDRKLTLDEGAKLVRAFELEQPLVPVLPLSVIRLVVRYIASEIGSGPQTEERLEEVAEDVRAFSTFVTDPKIRGSTEAAETFFQAMRLRRPQPSREDQRENGPAPAH